MFGQQSIIAIHYFVTLPSEQRGTVVHEVVTFLSGQQGITFVHEVVRLSGGQQSVTAIHSS